MRVKLLGILNHLYVNVDSAIVDEFNNKFKQFMNKNEFVDTDKADFQLALRDFIESHENDYQYDLIKDVLDNYYDHSYDLIDEIDERFLGPSEDVINDSKQKGLYTEARESNFTEIDTGLSDKKAEEILNSVIGQLSDGIWENSRGMERYWQYADIETRGSEIYIAVNTEDYYSGFRGKTEDQIKKYFATKIKQIIKEEGLDWNRNNTDVSTFLDRGSGVTVQDAYRVYDKLLGRKDRITIEESYNIDGFENSEALQEFFQNLEDLPDEFEYEGKSYICSVYGALGRNKQYIIYEDKSNPDSYIKVFYTLHEIEPNHFEGLDKVLGVSDLREED